MKKEEIMQQRRNLFSSLEEEFTDELIPAKHTREEDGSLDAMTAFFEDLVAEGNETIGEFFFMPFAEEAQSDMQIFVNYFTIAENLAEENLMELFSAACTMNAFIPVGAFSYDVVAQALIYRHATEMPMDLSDEMLRDRIDMSMGMAVQTLTSFGYMLLEVAEGKRDADSLLRSLTTADQD